MLHIDDASGRRFAVWVGPGRDPQVAYLDARQLAIATSELGMSGRTLYGTGASYNTLGGQRDGEIHASILHRIVHGVKGRDGIQAFELETPCAASVLDSSCGIARREPRPGLEAEPEGRLVFEPGFAVGWVSWADPDRAGVLRRAVYLDDRYLLEAGLGPDAAVRAWPARGLAAAGIEMIAPPARELAVIEERVATVTARTSSIARRA